MSSPSQRWRATPSRSTHSRAIWAPISALFWWSAEMIRTAIPPPVAANSSAASSAATTEPRRTGRRMARSYRSGCRRSRPRAVRPAPHQTSRLKRQQQHGHQDETSDPHAGNLPLVRADHVTGYCERLKRSTLPAPAQRRCARWLMACFSSGSISPKVCSQLGRTAGHEHRIVAEALVAAGWPDDRPSIRPRNVSVWRSGQPMHSAAMNHARRSGLLAIRSMHGRHRGGEILRCPAQRAE